MLFAILRIDKTEWQIKNCVPFSLFLLFDKRERIVSNGKVAYQTTVRKASKRYRDEGFEISNVEKEIAGFLGTPESEFQRNRKSIYRWAKNEFELDGLNLSGSGSMSTLELESLDDEGFYELFYLYVALLVLRYASPDTVLTYSPEIMSDQPDPYESAKKDLIDRTLLYHRVFGNVLSDPYTIEKISKALSSMKEDEMIEKVLLPLLHRMGFRGMRVGPHGPLESGQDIRLFFKENEFGVREYYTVQAKAVKIHGDSRAQKGNAAEIARQLDTALASPFIDLSDSTEKRVDHVLLITSKEIVETARRFLASRFSNRQMIQIDNTSLSDLVARYGMARKILASQ